MTGAASYLEQGYTNVPLALTLMTTSIPGAAIGAHAHAKTNERTTQRSRHLAVSLPNSLVVSAPPRLSPPAADCAAAAVRGGAIAGLGHQRLLAFSPRGLLAS
jgi:hypothetical protein